MHGAKRLVRAQIGGNLHDGPETKQEFNSQAQLDSGAVAKRAIGAVSAISSKRSGCHVFSGAFSRPDWR